MSCEQMHGDGRPAHRERAPLRLVHCGQLFVRTRVAPLIASGLHCGLHSGRPHGTIKAVAPLIASGLHCGTVDYQANVNGALVSPRSSRAGSIAATSRAINVNQYGLVAPLIASGLHCGSFVDLPAGGLSTSPRSSRAGSIAARQSGTRARDRLHAGRPAHRERAPLRPLLLLGALRDPGVAPLIASGLHCGAATSTMARGVTPCRPAHRERAPLRHRPRRPYDRRRRESPRSSRAGSIAATCTATTRTAGQRVAPLIASGLHCGVMNAVVAG